MKPYMFKLDAPDALLLSENVCYKLNIVTYHPDVPLQPCTQKYLGHNKGHILNQCDILSCLMQKIFLHNAYKETLQNKNQ